MFEINNYSRSVVPYEDRMNKLISNVLIRLISLYDKREKEEISLTETDLNLFRILDTLSETEYNCLKELLNIINSGILKYFNKYYIIDTGLSINTGVDDKPFSRIEVYCKLISDPAVFRKISKKLYKEDEDIFVINKENDPMPYTIKSLIDISYVCLSSIINEIMKMEDAGFKYYNFTCNSMEELNKTLDINITFFEMNIVRKFQS